MTSLRLSNIDEYVSGAVRTDAIEIVVGEQKTFVSNSTVDMSNYSFSAKVDLFNATVSYTTTGVAITGFTPTGVTTYDRNDMMVLTQANPGIVDFRIPSDLIPSNVDVPVDSSTPLVAVVTITINTDTTASFPTIKKESVAIIIRYGAR